MITKVNIFITAVLLVCSIGRSQSTIDSSSQFVFLPKGLHFAPLRANIQEPRIGVFKYLNAGQMKVDIGNTIDVFGLWFPHSRFTAGIDFFAYAFVTGSQGLRLQIDAIDGFFGGNLTFSHNLGNDTTTRLYARLRILHHSAHLVDGHYLQSIKSWADNREPIPYTRDFGELTLAHTLPTVLGNIRYYGGISYATLVRPADIERISYLAGTEIYNDIGTVFKQPVNLYIAYSMSLVGTPVYAVSYQLQAGIKFGEQFDKGPSIYLAYYTGRHMFAEYFDQRITTIGAGFTVDFF